LYRLLKNSLLEGRWQMIVGDQLTIGSANAALNRKLQPVEDSPDNRETGRLSGLAGDESKGRAPKMVR
jgi:hypothetical protein